MRLSQLRERRYPRTPSDTDRAQAEADGFDTGTLWFHGTRKRFDDFVLPKEPGVDELGSGVYVTTERWLANTWARAAGFILSCYVRRGPLFDYATIDSPEAKAILCRGYFEASRRRWPTDKTPEDKSLFDTVLRNTWDRRQLYSTCLSAAGFVGAFKNDSQIKGQIVVFDPADVRIVARERGE